MSEGSVDVHLDQDLVPHPSSSRMPICRPIADSRLALQRFLLESRNPKDSVAPEAPEISVRDQLFLQLVTAGSFDSSLAPGAFSHGDRFALLRCLDSAPDPHDHAVRPALRLCDE